MSQFDDFRQHALDALFGSMPDHLERLTWDADRIRAERRDRCRALLAVATERSPFHARRLRSVDPATFELDDLSRLPVMTKVEMMEHFDDVVTDRRVTRAGVERAIEATTTAPVPISGEHGDVVVITTGGSSGRRGVFAFDVTAFATFGATLMRPAMARLAGGGGPPAGFRIAMVAAASPIHATGCATRMLAGSPMPFVSVPVTLPLDEIVARLQELEPPLLYGYPSVLARLAKERQAGRLRIAPLGVTTTSETLRPDLRQTIAAGFGVPIVNVYGTSEGLVGVSPPDDRWLAFADDCCIVELVDEHDQPVPPGSSSAAVLVTNLYNHVQPLIRYRIEDRFLAGLPAADHGHLRARGRGPGRRRPALRPPRRAPPRHHDTARPQPGDHGLPGASAAPRRRRRRRGARWPRRRRGGHRDSSRPRRRGPRRRRGRGQHGEHAPSRPSHRQVGALRPVAVLTPHLSPLPRPPCARWELEVRTVPDAAATDGRPAHAWHAVPTERGASRP